MEKTLIYNKPTIRDILYPIWNALFYTPDFIYETEFIHYYSSDKFIAKSKDSLYIFTINRQRTDEFFFECELFCSGSKKDEYRALEFYDIFCSMDSVYLFDSGYSRIFKQNKSNKPTLRKK